MKVENNAISPLSPQGTDPAQHVDRKNASSESGPAELHHDHADVSENARLLAKARLAMDKTNEAEDKKVEMLRQSVQSGDYTVQVEAIARKLANRLIPGT